MKLSWRLSPWLVLLLATFVLARATGAVASEPLELGPMLGHVGPTEARLWFRAPPLSDSLRSAPYSAEVRVSDGPNLARTIAVSRLTLAGPEYLGQIHVTGLKPATRYHYQVLTNDEPGARRSSGSFTTAPAEGTPGKFRFAFVSCAGRDAADAAAAWGDLAARTPVDLVLLLGDNHYADSTDPARQRAAYYDQRRLAGFRDLSSRVACYGIWDDHDFGPNNSDATSTGRELSLRTFKEFWPNPAFGQRDDPGVYFKFARGDTEFFMLDVRYHRSPNASADDGSKTMLGAAQRAWLKRELAASKAKVKFIASGSEWQSHGTVDSWSNFNRERMELFDYIRERDIPGVVLLSGDRHLTAAYQILGKFIEVTSGPIGSPNATRAQPAAEAFYFVNAGKLYCVFEVDTSGANPRLTLEVYRAAEGLIHRRELTWNEILGLTKIPPLPPPARC